MKFGDESFTGVLDLRRISAEYRAGATVTLPAMHRHEQRLYQLIRQSSPGKDRLFEIEFLAPGVRAYAFTFG